MRTAEGSPLVAYLDELAREYAGKRARSEEWAQRVRAKLDELYAEACQRAEAAGYSVDDILHDYLTNQP